jgi:hypothetical protein
MDADERAQLIEQYATGMGEFEAAIAGITDAELDARPGPGDWTPREVIHHLADSEMRAAIRLRQLIAEDEPQIQGYDENAYAKTLHYERPIGSSVAAARAARETSAELLTQLTPAEWERTGTHAESGAYSVDTWLRIYASHPRDHADQVRRARASASTS